MTKRTIFFLFLIAFIVAQTPAEPQFSFYGNYISLESYMKLMSVYGPFETHYRRKNFDRALEIAEDIRKLNPDIASGYKMLFQIGMAKQELSLVKESLWELRDKYFFYIYDYNRFLSSLDGVKDGQFKKEAIQEIDDFFVKREEFLKKKLGEKSNSKLIFRELTLLNYETGDEDEFLYYLEKMMSFDYSFAQRFSNKPEWGENNRLEKLGEEFRNKLGKWEGTLEQKVKTILLISTEMKSRNASLDFAPIVDWNSHVASYVPRIIMAKDKKEFYEVLAEMISRVGENHTAISFPSDIKESHSTCGLETIYTSGKFLVKKVVRHHFRDKIKQGDEIFSINEIPVMEYIEQNKSLYPFVSYYYLKPEIHALYRIGEVLLAGKRDSKINAGFKHPDGSTYFMSLSRDFYQEEREREVKRNKRERLIELTALKGDIYCFNIKRFFGSDIYEDFLSLIKDLDTTQVKGVIFDLRQNPGGNSSFGDRIFSHFITKPKNNYIFQYYPAHLPLQEVRGFGYLSDVKGGLPISPAEDKKFDCPVVVMISPRTGSAAEDFSFLFKYHKRGIFVGLPTSGGTGNGYYVYLPGGGSLRICLNVDLFYSWKGIQPDHRIEDTVQDIIELKDPQMEKALQILINNQ